MKPAWSALLLAVLPAVHAQQFTPHVGYVYPAGGQQGKTFEVIVGGQFLDGVNQALVSGPGVEAKIVKHDKLMTMGQFNRLRDELQELNDKRKAGKSTPEDEKHSREIVAKMATFIRRPAAPSIAERVTVQITLAADAPPGEREFRLATANGLTNPTMFCVGQLPEFSKTPARIIDELAPGKGSRFRASIKPAPEGPLAIQLPAVVNGQVGPGKVDRIRFQAAKGLHLVIAASARELIPYISDAVPGWFQATIALKDSSGKELNYADHYRFHPDPVLYYEMPADGEYTLEIKDSIYRGREDFVYRITLGELPFITSAFPLGGKTGERTAVELKGWNLPVSKLNQDAKRKAPGLYPVSVHKGGLVSNPVPFTVDTLPERRDQEPNNQARKAQSIKLPAIVNGRINQPGDWDVFRIQAQAGEEIVAEVFARRLDSPLDSGLKLTDSTGREIAINDDHEDKSTGLLTHHADSLIRATLPKKGTYYLHLGDTQGKGGPEYAYRLRLNHPQPDFELRIVPASVSARAGTTVPVTIYAMRRDGFTGDIALKLKDAPKGFALSGAWVPSDQDSVRLTLTVPVTEAAEPLHLALEGHAVIRGKETVRAAVPAEDMMQAFAYHHLVPAKDWLVQVSKGQKGRAQWRLAADKPVKLSAAGASPVRVVIPMARYLKDVQLTLSEPPEGIAIRKVSSVPDGVAITLSADLEKVKPGLKGNLIVDAFTERTQTSGGGSPRTTKRRQALGTLPAIPFEVVAATATR